MGLNPSVVPGEVSSHVKMATFIMDELKSGGRRGHAGLELIFDALVNRK